MATIEELEIQLAKKFSIIDLQLSRFEDNLNRIGKVIGKDPGHVYDVLKNEYDLLISNYGSLVNKNVGILSILIEKSDKILSVLKEISSIIKKIESSHDEDMLSVAEEIDQKMESISSSLEESLGEDSKQEDKKLNLVGYVVPGLAAYVFLRMINVNRTVSFAASAAISLILNAKRK